jgi:hypothetical protein
MAFDPAEYLAGSRSANVKSTSNTSSSFDPNEYLKSTTKTPTDNQIRIGTSKREDASFAVSEGTVRMPGIFSNSNVEGGGAAFGNPNIGRRKREQPEYRAITPVESFAAGVTNRGFAQPAIGLTQFATGGTVGGDKAREFERDSDMYQSANPITYGAGAVTGEVGKALALPLKNIGLVKGGALYGGASGALTPNLSENTGMDYYSDQAMNAAIGGAGGAAIGGAFKAAPYVYQGAKDIAKGVDVARVGEYPGRPSAYQPVNPTALQQLSPRDQRLIKNAGDRVETQGMGAQAFGENLYKNVAETLSNPLQHLPRMALQGIPAAMTGGASLPFTLAGEAAVKTLRDRALGSRVKVVPESQGELLLTPGGGMVGGATNTGTPTPRAPTPRAPTPTTTIEQMIEQTRTQFPNYTDDALNSSVVNQRAKQMTQLDPNLDKKAARTMAAKEVVLARDRLKADQEFAKRNERAQQELDLKQQKQSEIAQSLMAQPLPSGMRNISPEDAFRTNPLIKPITERAQARLDELNPQPTSETGFGGFATSKAIPSDKVNQMLADIRAKQAATKTEVDQAIDEAGLLRQEKAAQSEFKAEVMDALSAGNLDRLKDMGVPMKIIDTGKGVYGDSATIRKKAEWLSKNGVDELPDGEAIGITDSTIIHRLYEAMGGPRGPVKPGRGGVSFMIPEEAPVAPTSLSSKKADIDTTRPVPELEGMGTRDNPFPSRADMEAVNLFNVIARKDFSGTYKKGDKIIDERVMFDGDTQFTNKEILHPTGEKVFYSTDGRDGKLGIGNDNIDFSRDRDGNFIEMNLSGNNTRIIWNKDKNGDYELTRQYFNSPDEPSTWINGVNKDNLPYPYDNYKEPFITDKQFKTLIGETE